MRMNTHIFYAAVWSESQAVQQEEEEVVAGTGERVSSTTTGITKKAEEFFFSRSTPVINAQLKKWLWCVCGKLKGRVLAEWSLFFF